MGKRIGEYLARPDYFGRGVNEVMKHLKHLKTEARHA